MTGLEADFVIVGGGSAGCALAARLTEDPSTKVVLLEAGGEGKGWKVDLPVGMMYLVGHDSSDWGYRALPDPTINNRVVPWAAGKMLGGGSAINGQLYIRGLRSDYDGWAAKGCVGWSFDDVLPFFKKSEGFDGENSPPSHGLDGPLRVSRPRNTHPLLKTFVKGFEEIGLPHLDDYCGGEQFGVFEGMATQYRGKRCSAARAYLFPAMSRPNLKVITRAYADKIVFADGAATGVQATVAGSPVVVQARREVIVCAGALASPALLLRSGVGDAEALRNLGLAVNSDLPGVGRNLQEHAAVLMNRLVNVPTYNSQMGLRHMVLFGLQYLLMKQGPLASLSGQGVAFAKTRPSLADPDIQYHFSGASYDLDADGRAVLDPRPGVLITTNVCRPKSRGRITISSPTSPPTIAHQTYGDPADLETMIAGCKLADAVFDSRAFAPYMSGRLTPTETPATDREWETFIRQKTVYAYHPAGTCQMGVGPDSVVDPQLRVRNVRGLRVADASIMPSLISANTNAACIMIGEKLADLIKRQPA